MKLVSQFMFLRTIDADGRWGWNMWEQTLMKWAMYEVGCE